MSSVNSINQGSVSTKLSSMDRSMTIIDGCASESFGNITPDKIPQVSVNQEAYKEQRIVRQPSEQNTDLRPVVTVDNSLLIKIMARLDHFNWVSFKPLDSALSGNFHALTDQNQALLGKINSLGEENKQLQSAQDAQYKVLFEKINQLSKENHQVTVLKWTKYATKQPFPLNPGKDENSKWRTGKVKWATLRGNSKKWWYKYATSCQNKTNAW